MARASICGTSPGVPAKVVVVTAAAAMVMVEFLVRKFKDLE